MQLQGEGPEVGKFGDFRPTTTSRYVPETLPGMGIVRLLYERLIGTQQSHVNSTISNDLE